MKVVILNGSPRKNWSTAQLLREAQKGAESVGAQTEYIDLFDLSYTGCRSCLACKRKGAERCKCFWRDDLSPVIDRIFAADALIIGCPKLDAVDYSQKLTAIIRDNDVRSVTILRMEVPCCGGLQHAAETALKQSGKFIPWQVVTISRDGRILD